MTGYDTRWYHMTKHDTELHDVTWYATWWHVIWSMTQYDAIWNDMTCRAISDMTWYLIVVVWWERSGFNNRKHQTSIFTLQWVVICSIQKKTDKGKKLQNYPQMWRLYVIEGFSYHNYTALKTKANEGSTPWPLGPLRGGLAKIYIKGRQNENNLVRTCRTSWLWDVFFRQNPCAFRSVKFIPSNLKNWGSCNLSICEANFLR